MRHRRRELRRAAEAAVDRVEQCRRRPRTRGRARRSAGPSSDVGDAAGERVRLDRGDELVGLLGHVVAAVRPHVGDRVHDPREAGHAAAVGRREVRAAVERAAVGREEHGHRPAALAGERLHRVHVDGVDVGPLLAVDLHVHEQPVHRRGDVGVLERLVRHHVAPVARRVADRQQDRLVLGRGPGQRLLAPRVPVDRVVGVLAQVRAGLVREAVHAVGGYGVRVRPRGS